MSDLPEIALIPFDTVLAAEVEQQLRLPVRRFEPGIAGSAALWVFIDWLLPQGSGFEFCRRLRADQTVSDARLLLVLEDDARETRRRALHAGADDYVLGPLSVPVIEAKLVDAAPPVPRGPKVLAQRDLLLDRDAFQVRAAGAPVPMSPNEFRLLEFFMENPDRVLSREQLIGALKTGEAVDERTVDVWIGRLRRALLTAQIPDPIRTVRKLGYVYDSF
jgi:two-component system phosphate regulon response regulator PhoB